MPFALQLEVHDEQCKLASEEQDISLKQLEKLFVSLDTECDGSFKTRSPLAGSTMICEPRVESWLDATNEASK